MKNCVGSLEHPVGVQKDQSRRHRDHGREDQRPAQRAQQLAEQHGFQITQAARNLRLERTRAISVVLPLGHESQQHLSDPFFMSLLGPLADAFAERGHDMLLSRVIPRNVARLPFDPRSIGRRVTQGRASLAAVGADREPPFGLIEDACPFLEAYYRR